MTLRSLAVGLVPSRWRIRKRALQAWAHGERELRLLSLLCERNALAVDIGANYGIYSYFMSKYSAGVVAFEPVPEFASFIRSALPKVRVVEAAASDHCGTATLRIPVEANHYDSSPTLEPHHELNESGMRSLVVNLVTLDSLGLGRVGFIKIDVEGHEPSVLMGALTTIERDYPTLLVEAEERHRPGAAASVQELLSSRDYRGFFLFGGRVEPIETFDGRTHQDVALLCSGPSARTDVRYVNNFIFIHRGKDAIVNQLLKGRV